MKEKREFEESFGSLDEGLRAGFGASRRGSVIGCLEDRTGSVLRLTLPDADEDREPVVKPVGLENAASMGARYQVLGEIARGGLGIVMKSRDVDLGRDVAVKVLHERFKDDRQVIERFVEEAQIGGQLQHPGIVPVYELGLQADDRPFFAMKLVKGDTLAAMLKKRRDSGEDLQRFLRIFLQICQTVAYAHVRRVVHRDLKPSNVLVGAFGEVQVVDWGLAKVLRGGGVADEPARAREASVIETIRSAEGSSHSIAGSVMGTPAYMPPEQARGEVEHMDPRSDAFSLGAILCEILSGEPPYDAEDPAEAVRAAADCRLDPAFRRLEACGADAELVELTKTCLAPSRAARPEDAGEVAKRVENHLQALEERAQKAEVRAAELRVRTRSYLTLAAVVVLALVLSGWAYLAWDGQVRARREETALRANAAIVETTRLAGQAEQAGLAGVALWQSAVSAATRALEIVETGEADAELERRVEELVAEVTREEGRTRAEALEEKSHDLVLEQLVEVRVGPDVPRVDVFQGPQRRERESARRAREYAELFDSLGFDGTTTVEEATVLFDCVHRQDWALALDAWAEARRVSALFEEGPDPEAWRGLVRAARGIDPEDPWRNALRDEMTREKLDVEALRNLAIPAELRSRTAEEIAIVVALIDAAGDIQGALQAQIEGMYLHPSDYWLNHSFASLCNQEELTGRIYREMEGLSSRAAFALRPESRAARFNLGLSWGEELDTDELFQELLEEDPDDQIVQAWNFMLLMERGLFDEAAKLFPDVLPALQLDQLDWDYGPFVVGLGYADQMLETPGVPRLMHGFVLAGVGLYEEAWDIIEQHRHQADRIWPWYFVPIVIEQATSAESLRAIVERLRALATADEAELRKTPTRELLAAAEYISSDWNDLATATRLFAQAFENDPTSKELMGHTRTRQVAAFWAALASGGVTPKTVDLTLEERAELRAQALGWMHEELDVIERDLASPGLDRRTAVRYSRSFHQMTIYGWLAPIREKEYLARMSPEQAHACRVLWARIAGLEAMLVDLTGEG